MDYINKGESKPLPLSYPPQKLFLRDVICNSTQMYCLISRRGENVKPLKNAKYIHIRHTHRTIEGIGASPLGSINAFLG